jgi:hypothetical protein
MQAVVHGDLLPTLATLGELLEATKATERAMVKEAMERVEAEEMTPVACKFSFL